MRYEEKLEFLLNAVRQNLAEKNSCIEKILKYVPSSSEFFKVSNNALQTDDCLLEKAASEVELLLAEVSASGKQSRVKVEKI